MPTHTAEAPAPMSSSPGEEKPTNGTDYDELNTLWKARETAIALSYLHHPNRDEWCIHFIRCLAMMVAGPPDDGSERTPSAPRPLALAETLDRLTDEVEIQKAKTELNAIWGSRVYRITVAYIIAPDREAWLVNFVSCLAKIAEGPAQAAAAASESAATDVVPNTEQSPRLFQHVSYDRTKWFRIEGGGTMYGVELEGASTKFSLPAGAKLWTADFSKVSVLTDDGYRPVSQNDFKTGSRGTSE
ncbi:hypothetical protein B0H65DRAFT_521065 [Neurospora tetraspora]|uniref:Uncharacterized protein n=1 Tax=Neurospora tetraspora TaxID=94610 RepID=A0AAE0JLZ2_9PEZI|nr:hypothetical protein B0H65DRAFT_521065 [Neurospora tetraspora]